MTRAPMAVRIGAAARVFETICHYPPVSSFPNGIAHLCVDGPPCATRHDRHDDGGIEMKKHPPHRKTHDSLSSNGSPECFVWSGASKPRSPEALHA
jgi:hypothetical protein